MNRAVFVDNKQSWRESLETLGQRDHAVTVWKVRDAELAEQDAAVIKAAFEKKALNPTHIPASVVDAALAVAQRGGRYNLKDGQGLNTAPTAFGGHGYPLTGLHADTHIENGTPKSAPLKCLYVGVGAVEAYFRLLPVNFISADLEEKDRMMGDRYERNLKSCTGMAMRASVEHEFIKVEAEAGTIMAFPAAGDPARGVAAAEHEIRSATEYRVTVPFEDYLFRNLSSVLGHVRLSDYSAA